jgi:hypothetical protein
MARVAKNAQKAAPKPPSPPPPEPPRPEDDPLLFTPTPADGFPLVHGRTSTRIFDNLDHEQMSVWLTLDMPHVFVQPLLHGYYPPTVAPEIVHLIRETIQLALGVTGIKVTAPSQAEAVDRLDKAPFTYLVRGMSASDANRLASQYCLASRTIGILIFKAGIQAPTYLGAIDGLAITDQADHESVLQLVAETYLRGPVGEIIDQISADNPNLQSFATNEDRVVHILRTLTGRRLEMNSDAGSKRIIFNIYIQSPTSDDDDWARLLEEVHKTTYRHPLLGSGFHHAPWSCNFCHGIDHPSGHCIFPRLPGWIIAAPHKPIVDFRLKVTQDISRRAAAERAERSRQRALGRGQGTPASRGRGGPRH